MFNFRSLQQKIVGSEFTKNTFTIIIGTVIAQAIPLILHPFLRRIYQPEDFGAMAIYLNIFGMITIVSALRYEATIVLPKNNIEAANILFLTFLLNMIFSVLILLIVFAFKTEIIDFIEMPAKYAYYIYVLPFSCLLFGVYQGINFWLIRQKAFKASSKNKIVRRGLEGIVQLVFGILKIPSGLIAGDFIGNLGNTVVGVKQATKNRFQLRFISRRKIHFVFRKYIEYPKYNMFPTLLSSAASFLPFFFINKFYSTEMLGYIDLTRLVLSIPLVFISTTISQVFYQQAAENKNNDLSIKNDVLKILYILASIIVLEIVVVFFFGPQLFEIVFGSQYGISGYFAQVLIFSFAANFITSTFSSTYMIFEKIRYNSIWQIIYFSVICSLTFFKYLTIYDFIKVYVFMETAMHLINGFIVYSIINKYETKLKRKLS